MKTIKFIISTMCIFLGLSACEQQLVQIPLTQKTADGFYQSEAEIESAVNAVYATLQFSGNYRSMLAIGTISGEDVYEETAANDGGVYNELSLHNVQPDNWIPRTAWENAYKSIQRANIVFARMENVAFKDETVKEMRKGELKFIRAFSYFNLVRVFGEVPLILEEVEPLKAFGTPREEVDKVYVQIEKDLTEAIGVLPNRTDANKNRVVKTAAQALLGRVKLTQKDYAGAKVQLEAVVGSNLHELVPVEDVFDINKELNKEIIFAVQFETDLDGRREGSDAFRVFNPSARDGRAKGHGTIKRSFYDLYDATDLRLGAYLDTTADGIAYTNKFKEGVAISNSPSDWVLLRYADVLLMLAEIENQNGNPTKALEYLNAVRTRASLANATETDKNALADAIDLERRKELIWEGHRWFDLLRTERVRTVFPNVEAFRYLLPLPSVELATDPSLVQNTGY